MLGFYIIHRKDTLFLFIMSKKCEDFAVVEQIVISFCHVASFFLIPLNDFTYCHGIGTIAINLSLFNAPRNATKLAIIANEARCVFKHGTLS
jgi:hypothetical protein